ncbi:hypothetical protein EZV73_01920 [Acidaminobacter sp. JC074]|uniref:PucR family transcriptional regulator n=1 Tax=Acidaminobacter sp. JC074 TaxID=2530199 RepID=UPI001F0E69F6|nr:PucR family transcriptional regulator [Acidaminobacter sp. JC074]MCH4886302.1 hypothetical protein [Acidaminobacter sp. JC074]
MFVTVGDILKIKALNKAKILAGKDGLRNIVSSINIYEYILKKTHDRRGEMYLTSFYDLKDQGQDALYDHIEILIDTDCPGLIMALSAFDEISDRIADLADRNNFPIIGVSPEVTYADILEKAYKLILENKRLSDKSVAFHRIMNLEEPDVIEKHLKRLNPSFRKYYYIAYVDMDEAPLSDCSLPTDMECFEYEDNYIIIKNSDDPLSSSKLKTLFSEIFIGNSHIGISQASTSLKNFKDLVYQSKQVCQILKHIMNEKIRSYDEIGIYKMLIHMSKDASVIQSSRDVVALVKDYDDMYKSSILETFSVYLKNSCDVQKTADLMFVHKNTVRYRLKKIETIIDNVNNDCMDQLSLALRILWLEDLV